MQLQLKLQLHYKTATTIATTYNLQLQLHYTTLHFTTLHHYTTPRHTKLQYTTANCNNKSYNSYNYYCSFSYNITTLQHYNITTTATTATTAKTTRTRTRTTTTTTTATTTTTTTTTLQYNYNHNCTYNYIALHYATIHPAVVVEVTTARISKAQLQPPFGPSVDSPCHRCITASHLSYGVLSLKLPNTGW